MDPSRCKRLLDYPIRGLDAVLRRAYGIRDFTDDPHCLLRLAAARSDSDRELSDGTKVARGDPIAELHLWNEHLPPVGPAGADIAWGREATRRARASCVLLVNELNQTKWRNVRAIRVALNVGGWRRYRLWVAVLRHWGFDVSLPAAPNRWTARVRLQGENLLASALAWTFSPTSFTGWRSPRWRLVGWISRESFVIKHSSQQAKRILTPADRCHSIHWSSHE